MALSIVAGVITLQFGDEVVNNEDITQKVQQKNYKYQTNGLNVIMQSTMFCIVIGL